MDYKFTPQKRQEFFEALAKSCNVTKACEEVGISRMTVYNNRESDPAFAEQWEQAMKIGLGALEDEVHRRAFDGTLVASKHGVFKQYSDTLAIFLLKAHDRDKYMDRSATELSTPDLALTDDQIAIKLAAIAMKATAKMGRAQEPETEPVDDFSDLA